MSILSNLSEEEKEQLKDYVNAIKETKRAIKELVSKAKGKAQMEDKNWGGPRKDMVMPVEQAGKRNVVDITLYLDPTLLKRFQTIPAYQRLLHPNQIKALNAGLNRLSVNHSTLSSLEDMGLTFTKEKQVNQK